VIIPNIRVKANSSREHERNFIGIALIRGFPNFNHPSPTRETKSESVSAFALAQMPSLSALKRTLRITLKSEVEIEYRSISRLASVFGSSLPLPPALDSDLDGALRHILSNPGNLIRLKLVFRTAMAYGLSVDRAQDLAVALEYFHTASLVFDDLPCMDDASVRRGAPCVHRVYGQADAILAALALINRAYALTWCSIAGCAVPIQLRALDFIEKCLGVHGLLNGQSRDLNFRDLPHTVETTERIAREKTVPLIRLTLVLPAMLGGASDRDLQQLERISLFWGLGYQMVDDLKDMLQNAAQSGKTPARDALLEHPNVAVILGIRPAVRRLTRLIDLGDRVLRHLVVCQPGLQFLGNLRDELQQELARVTRNCNVLAEEEVHS
jgi:geranylgeranyl pyrophosphate synthase